jgi:ATP-dependent DNA helicase RecG
LINSIAHRDYTNRAASISLAIYDDRLELWNNGVLPPPLSLADLRKRHESYPRNKTVATIFYEQGWVEGWGTGTTRMIRYCQENGTPEPEFQEYSGGLAVLFRFKEPMGEVRVFSPERQVLNSRQEKIIAILAGGKALSVNEVFNRLDDVASLRTIKADLASLKKLGLVEQVGKGRAAEWKIKV